MSKSLQDQLLGAGLIDNKKAKKISKETRKTKNEKRRNKDFSASESQQAAQRALQEKQARDKALNAELQAAAEKKSIAAQVIQLIKYYKVSGKGDVEYNFSDNNKIKKIWVSQKAFDEITRGRLTIARLDEGYELIPKPIADKIRERDMASVVVYNTGNVEVDAEQSSDDDDYYAQFEIPDDLMW